MAYLSDQKPKQLNFSTVESSATKLDAGRKITRPMGKFSKKGNRNLVNSSNMRNLSLPKVGRPGEGASIKTIEVSYAPSEIEVKEIKSTVAEYKKNKLRQRHQEKSLDVVIVTNSGPNTKVSIDIHSFSKTAPTSIILGHITDLSGKKTRYLYTSKAKQVEDRRDIGVKDTCLIAS